jgi:hypothetical protein
MELKNAVAICLISLFSAALVVLIARSLDMQTASRLEPQLTKIAEELKALRKAGGLPVDTSSNASDGSTLENGLMVYYMHGAARCPTCRSIESQTHEVVTTYFAEQVTNGEVAWKVLNYENSAVAPLAEKFNVSSAMVVLAKMKDGQIENWKKLEQVWVLVNEKDAFSNYIRDEIHQMLGSAKEQPPAPPPSDTSSVPVPE